MLENLMIISFLKLESSQTTVRISLGQKCRKIKRFQNRARIIIISTFLLTINARVQNISIGIILQEGIGYEFS